MGVNDHRCRYGKTVCSLREFANRRRDGRLRAQRGDEFLDLPLRLVRRRCDCAERDLQFAPSWFAVARQLRDRADDPVACAAAFRTNPVGFERVIWQCLNITPRVLVISHSSGVSLSAGGGMDSLGSGGFGAVSIGLSPWLLLLVLLAVLFGVWKLLQFLVAFWK